MNKFQKKRVEEIFNDSKVLIEFKEEILKSAEIIYNSYIKGGILLICGNGGSASDSEHIVAELMKSFRIDRPLNVEFINAVKDKFPNEANYLLTNLDSPIPAISLVSQSSLITAISNDNSSDFIFAQQVLGYGKKNDTLLAISTSGSSSNVINAVKVAKVLKMNIISITGKLNSELDDLSDVVIKAPNVETYKIQEFHIILYHAICLILETQIFGDKKWKR